MTGLLQSMDTHSSAQRLLVVDDEPFNLEIITDYFEGSGYQLDTAEHGEAAWKLLDSEARYDAILLDRMMPVLDGMALLKRIKGDSRFQQLPVIMQTAAGSPEQVREGLAAGAYYYLVKPYARDSLLSIVRGALADQANRQELKRQLSDHVSALQLLSKGSFELRTLGEASVLAAFLSQMFPQPESAALTLSELLVNAIEHGNLGISYAEKTRLRQEDRWLEEVEHRMSLREHRDKRVQVAISHEAEGIVVRIEDQGNGFDWNRYLEFDPARAFDPNGRGIALARMSGAAMIEYEGKGNIVVLRLNTVNQGISE